MMNTWNPAEIMERLNRLESIIKAGDVVANPTGEASTDLTKLAVDGTIYAIPDGTPVEANPEGEASGNLSSIGIGDTKYNIPTYTPIGYTTNEIDTGETWVNGAHIYKITIEYETALNLTYNQWIDAAVPSSLNINQLIDWIVTAGADAYYMCEVGLSAGGHTVGVRNDMNATRSMTKLTLYYTKSS